MSGIRISFREIVSQNIENSGKYRLGSVPGTDIFARRVWFGFLICVVIFGVLLFDVSEAWAQAATASTSVEPPSFGTVMQKMIPMFAICFAIFYLLVIGPQKKEIADQKVLLESLKKGDNVATSGGLLGRVTVIGEDYVTIALEQNAAVRVERNHIAKKL